MNSVFHFSLDDFFELSVTNETGHCHNKSLVHFIAQDNAFAGPFAGFLQTLLRSGFLFF